MPGEWSGQLDTSDTLLRISGLGILLYQARGLSQTELGDRIGVTLQQVQNYERGAHGISITVLGGLGTYLECV